MAIPPHIGTCASASSTNVGAAALAREPTARKALPAPISARGEKRASARPVRSATPAANGAATIRNWPAAAIETSKSAATRARIGDITSTPAWLANSARNSTTVGDANRAGRFATTAGESDTEGIEDTMQRSPSDALDRDGMNPRIAVRSTERVGGRPVRPDARG